MQLLVDTYTNTGSLHHAYAIVGQRDMVKNSLLLFFEQTLGIVLRGNPDIWNETYDTLGINEARTIRAHQTKSTASDATKKIFILSATAITHEAQNALLKIFEEPTRDTHFFLIIPDMEMLLPTLRSRLTVITRDKTLVDTSFAKDFLEGDISKRFAGIKDIIEDKNRMVAMELLDGLELLLHASLEPTDSVAEYAFVFSEIANCREYLRGRAPSLKLILEHIALITPRVII